MKVMITGGGGQVATALVKTQPPRTDVLSVSRAELDVSDRDAVMRWVTKVRPDILVNAAAYTAVDRAESEAGLAFRINADAAGYLAASAAEINARFIHISTDFVFDGTKSRPYQPADRTNPLNTYGASKLAGERQVAETLGARAIILRSSWVYAATGANFVNTMLRLMRDRQSLRVVSDQVGSPTWATSVAGAIWALVGHSGLAGIFHWTDAGVASWYDFAVAIQEEALALELLKKSIPIQPITTEEYPLPAARPAYSVLDKQSTMTETGITPAHWRVNLRAMLKELAHA
ncbi:MAG TPA: dTDP-4-dehydrorhamnose reductase [Gammaproteobacteria bacterium]|nr:dTDP-4-dehydrorhamnose reductase [Gammaproteobacteria bacterium]